jgi:hypothetical protein
MSCAAVAARIVVGDRTTKLAVLAVHRGTDQGRHAFLREFGLAEVTVAIMPDPPPGDRLVTANDDAANGSAGVIDGVVVPEEPPASVPVISARPEPVEAPITSAPESGL